MIAYKNIHDIIYLTSQQNSISLCDNENVSQKVQFTEMRTSTIRGCLQLALTIFTIVKIFGHFMHALLVQLNGTTHSTCSQMIIIFLKDFCRLVFGVAADPTPSKRHKTDCREKENRKAKAENEKKMKKFQCSERSIHTISIPTAYIFFPEHFLFGRKRV
ncbi:CLUMA_CG000887, isoform A [Clunio marinus]|uniref:CLUMA_CG000887, isoform A n=1 Tax=Clunio marinus TaxID=568069 RepID=A0A1J1HGT2_9DIPT|nr:CLUMA_CG000887, isoform A [Clunio marinus]